MTDVLTELENYIYCPRCAHTLVKDIIESNQVKKCTNCDFIFCNNAKPAVSILPHRNTQILMTQRAQEPFKGSWVLLGGFVGQNETLSNSVTRSDTIQT